MEIYNDIFKRMYLLDASFFSNLFINADLFFYKNKPINIKELIETMTMVLE